jgi:hypothetical protein
VFRIRIQSVQWIRIQEGKKKIENKEEISFSFLRAKGFYWPVEALYGGLKISKLQFDDFFINFWSLKL